MQGLLALAVAATRQRDLSLAVAITTAPANCCYLLEIHR